MQFTESGDTAIPEARMWEIMALGLVVNMCTAANILAGSAKGRKPAYLDQLSWSWAQPASNLIGYMHNEKHSLMLLNRLLAYLI
jgi:hypothetical protein